MNAPSPPAGGYSSLEFAQSSRHRANRGFAFASHRLGAVFEIISQRAAESIRDFAHENLAIVSIDPALAGYDQKRGGQVARDIVEQVRRDPQVRSADLGQFVPLGFGGEGRTIVAEGRDENAQSNRKIANISAVTPGYFETMRVPILRGRNFTEHDAGENAAKVAIISETMAKTFWPGEDRGWPALSLLQPGRLVRSHRRRPRRQSGYPG